MVARETREETLARRAKTTFRIGHTSGPGMKPPPLDLSILWHAEGRLYIPPELSSEEARGWRLFHERETERSRTTIRGSGPGS